MIRYRGNVLRAPTLHLRGEYQALTALRLGLFMLVIAIQYNLIQYSRVSGCGAVGSAYGWGP